MPTSKTRFQLAYDGPDLADHAMDVHTLGPALLAIGDLCRDAHHALNGPNAGDVKIRVSANFEERCFDISFEFIQDLYEKIKDLLGSDDVATADKIVALLFGKASLIGFMKWLRGRKVTKATQVEGERPILQITVQGDGDNTIVIDSDVWKLANDARVQQAQQRMLAPLLREGIEKFQAREEGEVLETVTKDDVEHGSFDVERLAPEEPDVAEPQVIDAHLRLRSPVFDEGPGWRFHWGDQKITAKMGDEQFHERVMSGAQRFGVGDQLEVRLRIKEVAGDGGKLRHDFEVVQVKRFREGAQQVPMLLAPRGEDASGGGEEADS